MVWNIFTDFSKKPAAKHQTTTAKIKAIYKKADEISSAFCFTLFAPPRTKSKKGIV
jgi:hypothetical protein